MSVTAAIICKDEAHHLFPCIASIFSQVDEIILCDTGSTDGTLNLDWLYDHQNDLMANGPIIWPNTAIFEHKWADSFADAKNAAIEGAQGDWILAIDADERLDGDLRGLMETVTDEQAFVVKVHSAFDGHWESVSPQVRLFRNRQGYKYAGRIHEQLYTPDGSDLPRTDSDLKFHHIGYDQRGITILGGKKMSGVKRLETKKQRNKRLLDMGLAEEPENPRYWYERMREHRRELEFDGLFEAANMCVTCWEKDGSRERDYMSPLLEMVLDIGRRTGRFDEAESFWQRVPAEYRTMTAWSFYSVVTTARIG